MVKVRGSYTNTPTCKDYDDSYCGRYIRYGYKYRAIESRHWGQSSYDLIPPHLVTNPVLNLSEEDDLKMDYQHNLFCACKEPDPKTKGQDAVYFLSSEKLDPGGRKQRYSPSIPKCDASLRRRALVDKKSGQPYSIHRNAIPPQDFTDPSNTQAKSLPQYFGKFGAVGLCQDKITNSRHALFWILEDPMKYLDDKVIAGASGDKSQELRKRLPEVMTSCTPVKENEELRLDLEDAVSKLRKEREERGLDAQIRMIKAPQIANQLVLKSGFPYMNDDQRYFLEGAVALGMQFGIDTDDIFQIAKSIFTQAENAEQFIYGVSTIIALRIARELNWINRSKGGLSSDTDAVIESVEKAITNGLISLKILDRDNADAGTYEMLQDRISFQPIDKKIVMISMFLVLLHESYHAYQDILAKRQNRLEFEMEAHEFGEMVGSSLHAVLNDDPLLEIDDKLKWLNMMRYQRFQLQRELSGLECIKLPDFMLKKYQETINEQIALRARWENIFASEINERSHALSRESLRTYLKLLELFKEEIELLKRNFIRYSFLYDAGEFYATPGEVKEWLQNRITKLSNTSPKTPEHDRESYQVMSNYTYYLSTSYYLDRSLMKELWEEYQMAADLIAEGLLYYQIPNNGI